MNPKVSVVMSVYNGEQFLEQAIESILGQTFFDFEFIVIDDGSTDRTTQIISQYARRDNRILLIQNPVNIGLTRSLNKGINLAKGEYIARHDADDVSHSTRLEKQVKVLENNPQVVLVSSSFESINLDGISIETTELARSSDLLAWYVLFVNYVGPHSTTMFRRGSVLKLGGYDEEFQYAQDYDLWSRLIWKGDFVVLPDVLLQWRDHFENISTRYSTQQFDYVMAVASRNLQQLTGKTFKVLDLNQLRKLWNGLPLDNGNLKSLHTNLRLIYQSFLQWRLGPQVKTAALSGQLRYLIGTQLLYCARTPSNLFSTFFFKLKMTPYAVAWHPWAAIAYWLKIPSKFIKKIKEGLSDDNPQNPSQ